MVDEIQSVLHFMPPMSFIGETEMNEDLIYQKKLIGKMVQTEFRHKHTAKKDAPVETKRRTKKTSLDFYGVETSDQPHLESFQ